MIPKAFLTEWRSCAPWSTEHQIEQDLVICRALVEIFSNKILRENLAFRGGTALHKLYFSTPPRYSEDIDLVQIKPGKIGEILRELQTQLQFLGNSKSKQKTRNNLLVFRFNSETAPISSLKLKVEINCREHFSIFGLKQFPFKVESRWFKGNCTITTYELSELLGTKLRALFQRKKGRDLFDIWYACNHTTINVTDILESFYFYMEKEGRFVGRKEFRDNLEEKINDPLFENDIRALLRPEINYESNKAFEWFDKTIISKMRG